MKDQRKLIIENYVKSYNNFDIKGMIKDMDNDVVFENIANGKVDLKTEGIVNFRKQAESSKRYFKERKQTIESWSFHEYTVSINIDYEAILDIDLPNSLKRGDILKLKGKSIFEFKKERIIKITDES